MCIRDSFITSAGTEYIIRIIPDRGPDGSNFNFSVECNEETANDRCINAIEISCGTEVTGNFENATHIREFNGCTTPFNNDLWYTFQGTGDLLRFEILENQVSDFQIWIYNSPCMERYFECNDRIALSFNNPDEREGIFSSEIDQQYWFQIISVSNFPQTNFSLLFECLEPEQNDICSNSTNLTCGENYRVDFARATPGSNRSNVCDIERDADVWFNINGDGSIYSFQFVESDRGSIDFSISQGLCLSLIHISEPTRPY